MIPCLALVSALLASAPLQGIPSEVRQRLLAQVERLSETHYVEEQRYAEVARAVGEAGDATTCKAALQLMTQLMFDHDAGNKFVGELAHDLESPGLAHVEFDVVPDELEVDRIVLKDGRELIGTGGSLIRHFPHRPKNDAQRYLEPNLGMEGLGGFWVAGEDMKVMERTQVPAPRAFLRAFYHYERDADGNLVADGLWFLPKVGSERRTITLTQVDEGSGGTLFVSDQYAIRCVRSTVHFASPGREDTERDQRGPRILRELADLAGSPEWPVIEEFRQRIDRLREDAPIVDWWWDPFLPDPARLAAAAARTDLIDAADPVESLLRVRFALLYGEDLPPLALEKPRLMLEIERRVQTAVMGGDPAAVERLTDDWRLVAAAIRHAPSAGSPPDRGLQGEHYVAFPSDYSPWRRWPLLVALHGQYCQPSYDYQAWREHAEREGMILLCPRYGSTRGAKRDQETENSIFDLIRFYSLRYNVDPDRIYLTGLSMGGATSWSLAMAHPSKWAAVAPEIHGPRIINKDTPELRNLWNVPLFVLEGEFDSLNTVFSRQATAQLKKWGAPVRYHEAGWFGHSRLTWMYPEVVDWFLAQRRDAHPGKVEHRTFHQMHGRSSWVAIQDLERAAAWERTDGSLSLVDFTGVEASYRDGTITLRRVEGRPKVVEIFHDDRLMTRDTLRIRARGRTKSWTPQPSISRMILRARATGDREQLYGDSIRIDM